MAHTRQWELELLGGPRHRAVEEHVSTAFGASEHRPLVTREQSYRRGLTEGRRLFALSGSPRRYAMAIQAAAGDDDRHDGLLDALPVRPCWGFTRSVLDILDGRRIAGHA